jgi:hypothetical protein
MKLSLALLMIVTSGCAGSADSDEDGVRATTSVTPGATYKLVRKGSNKCVDVTGGGSADGTGIQQWACAETANQLFRADDLGGGKVRLVNPATNKCVDVNGSGTANGTRIQLWSCNGTAAQAFTLQDQSGGYTRIKNSSSGKCADVSGGSSADGVNLQLWTCNTSSAQLWQFAGQSGGGGGGGGGGGDNITWHKANLTNFESYPDPDSDECKNYNGCMWAGQFAFVDGKQTESWVMMHNIVAVHSRDAKTYKLKNLRLRQGSKELDVTVYDECADSDCSGCCTANAKETGFLIDIEKYTMQRFGSGDGIVEWTCLDCK